MNQHDLLVDVLREAGGEDAASCAPAGYRGKIADILFREANVVVEVKSLTTDRAASSQTSDAVGEMFAKHVHLGAPVIFGTVSVSLHDLPSPIAANTLRIGGKRVLDEAKNANRQIKATKALLDRPDALGVLALITPPFKLDRHSIVWLIGDAIRGGRCSGIDELLLIETRLGSPQGGAGNSFLSRHTREGGDRAMQPDLVQAIGTAWGAVTGQPQGQADEADYPWLGATS